MVEKERGATERLEHTTWSSPLPLSKALPLPCSKQSSLASGDFLQGLTGPICPIQAESPAGSDTRPGSAARRDTPGSISFVPAAAGLVLASAVIRDLGEF